MTGPIASSNRSPEAVHAYALLDLVDDYLRLGWMAHGEALAGTYHGQYSCLVEWRCCCGREVVRPMKPRAAKWDRIREVPL